MKLLPLLLLLALPVVLQAQFTFTTNNGAITITGYTGSDGAVVIPSATNGYPVTSIGVEAFYSAGFTNVLIPDSVTNIGDEAFLGCTSLISVTIPANITSIGYGVFADCLNLTGVTIPDGVTSIGDSAFNVSGLTKIKIPNSVTNLGSWSFEGCIILTNIAFPNNGNVNIGYDTFGSCYSLASVTIPANVTRIGSYAFAFCDGLTNLTLANGVANIGSNAFLNCSRLTSVTIPGSVTNLGSAAFANCFALTNVTILDGVTTITKDTFTFCTSLTTVTIPNSVTSIEINAFGSCSSLASITIPTSVTNIWSWVFNFCPNLMGIYFNGNAPSFVGYDVFYASPNVIIYYLPGTTGWDATFVDRPTALWLPQMQMTGSSFGGQSNPFGFNITWANGQTVVVEAGTNLFSPYWQPVQTNTLTTGTAYFSDPQWTNYSSRLYRLRSQ